MRTQATKRKEDTRDIKVFSCISVDTVTALDQTEMLSYKTLGSLTKALQTIRMTNCEDETHMGYIYPYQTTMHEGSGILVEGSSIDQTPTEGSTYTSKDGISFEVHLHPSKVILRAHRRI